MSVPRTSFDIPAGLQIVDANGALTPGGQEMLSKFGNALTKLRDAADAMDELSASSTAAEIAAAWEEVREILQEIV